MNHIGGGREVVQCRWRRASTPSHGCEQGRTFSQVDIKDKEVGETRNSYPLPVSLLCPGGDLAAWMPDC